MSRVCHFIYLLVLNSFFNIVNTLAEKDYSIAISDCVLNILIPRL